MIALSTEIRNLRLNVIRDKVDSGGGAGRLCIYGGERPYTNGPAGTKLAEFAFSRPCAGDAEDGMLVFDPVEGSDASASGKATWARALNSRGEFVFDADCGKGHGDIQLKTVDLFQGMKVSVTSGSISEGNS